MIIYLRADKLHQNWFNKNTQNTKQAAKQLRLGGQVPRGGIPPAPMEFLVFISERMAEIVNSSHSGSSSSSSLVDSILPTLHEIHHCIVNNLVTPRESIIYKLLLDFYECTSDRVHLQTLLCPAATKFYKTITEVEINDVLIRVGAIQANIEKSYSD